MPEKKPTLGEDQEFSSSWSLLACLMHALPPVQTDRLPNPTDIHWHQQDASSSAHYYIFFCTLFCFFVFLNMGSSRMVASLGLAHRISIAQHGIIPRTTARTAKLDHLMGHFLLASPKFLGHFCLCLNSCTCTVSTKIFFCHFVLLPLCPLHLFSSCCFFALANSAAWS